MSDAFSRSALLRILECEDLESAVKILGKQSRGLMELKSAGNSAGVEAELLHVFDEVHKFVPDPALVELCRLAHDFHNVKVRLRTLLLREG